MAFIVKIGGSLFFAVLCAWVCSFFQVSNRVIYQGSGFSLSFGLLVLVGAFLVAFTSVQVKS
ncbi:MAG: hypothetical protein WC942_07285 [Clostridia bacterium]|jgi:hypothetical protein